MNPFSLLVVLSESQDNKCDFFSWPWVATVVWDCTCSEAHWKRRRGGGNEDIGNEEELGSKRIFSTTIKMHSDLTKSFNFTGDALLQNLKISVKLWNYNAKACFRGRVCHLLPSTHSHSVSETRVGISLWPQASSCWGSEPPSGHRAGVERRSKCLWFQIPLFPFTTSWISCHRPSTKLIPQFPSSSPGIPLGQGPIAEGPP